MDEFILTSWNHKPPSNDNSHFNHRQRTTATVMATTNEPTTNSTDSTFLHSTERRCEPLMERTPPSTDFLADQR